MTAASGDEVVVPAPQSHGLGRHSVATTQQERSLVSTQGVMPDLAPERPGVLGASSLSGTGTANDNRQFKSPGNERRRPMYIGIGAIVLILILLIVLGYIG